MIIQAIPYPAGAAAITVGEDNAGTANNGATANFALLAVAQATADGPLYYVHIRASSNATNEPFYITVYEVAGYTDTTGTLIGQCRSAALAANEVRTIALDSPVSVTAGNYYAFGILSAGASEIRVRATRARDRFFADTYSDGPLATSPTGNQWDKEPIIWGSTEGVEWEGTADMGLTSGTQDRTLSANFGFGKAFLAGRTGPILSLTVLGSSTAANTGSFRLVIYEVSGSSIQWGAKVGETAIVNSIGISEAKNIPLTSPAYVTKGRMYAFALHSNGGVQVRAAGNGDGCFYGDTFSDGSSANLGGTTSGPNGPPIISATID